MKVSIDLGICQGYAYCLMESPEVFDLDDSADQAVVMTPEPPAYLWPSAEAAARACPAGAITVER